jgi:hypothetical protein
MLKTLLSATAISALMVSGALAQTATPPASSTSPAATTASSGSAKFVTAQKPDQWLASKFKGTDVLGPNNEKVGDVNDVLFDRQGKVDAYIVGVGGFLGIGEKDVALEPTAFQVVPGSTRAASSTTSDTSRPAGAPATSTSSSTTTTTTSTTASAGDDDPTNVKLKISMTKDELKNAPAFERYKPPARTTGAGTGTNTGAAGPGDTAPARRP